MKKKLKEYYEGDFVSPAMIDHPLLDAMADGVKELELTREEFKAVMVYAVYNHLYSQVVTETESYPVVMAMRLKIYGTNEQTIRSNPQQEQI